jgi:hypothetical protein
MRITKEKVVAGHSAMRVRGFLRRFKRGFSRTLLLRDLCNSNHGRRQSSSTIWLRSNSLNS